MSFAEAFDHLEVSTNIVMRTKLDDHGNSAWRRVIRREEDGIYEYWPSGHKCLYTPTQEDMMAFDWKIV